MNPILAAFLAAGPLKPVMAKIPAARLMLRGLQPPPDLRIIYRQPEPENPMPRMPLYIPFSKSRIGDTMTRIFQ